MEEIGYRSLEKGIVEVLPQDVDTRCRITRPFTVYNTGGYQYRYSSVQGVATSEETLKRLVTELAWELRWLQENTGQGIIKFPADIKSKMRKELSEFLEIK